MKIVMLIFAVVLVATLSWFVWDSSHTSKSVNNSESNVSEKAISDLPSVGEWKTCSTKEALPLEEADSNDFTAVTAAQKAEIAAIKIDSAWKEYKGNGFTMMLPPTWTAVATDETLPHKPGKRFRVDFSWDKEYPLAVAPMTVYDLASFKEHKEFSRVGFQEIDKLTKPRSLASNTVSVTNVSINGASAHIVCSNYKLQTGEIFGGTKEYIIEKNGMIYYAAGSAIDYYFYYARESGYGSDSGSAITARHFQLAIESLKTTN